MLGKMKVHQGEKHPKDVDDFFVEQKCMWPKMFSMLLRRHFVGRTKE